MPLLVREIHEPIIFFLDGHYSSGNTAQGRKDCPLMEELSSINERMHHGLIIIDDVRLFGTHHNEDWSTITEETVLNCFSNGKVRKKYIYNDRMIICL